ncbi:hypothetical protein KP509_09G011300 [Ceratopteris richardii]|uniref:BHLH domain-containing protein n=1 Tax=Ceratopteris richardii TaxID=49495 RepID=A0A8T2TZ01_CERRI|nr:hypothetical protein KP509_09G011300 [Ceratopteris richardii]
MEYFSGSDLIDIGGAPFHTSFVDYYSQQPFLDEKQTYLRNNSGSGDLSDSTNPTLYSASAADDVISLARNLFHQARLSADDLQLSTFLSANQLIKTNRAIESEVVVPSHHTPSTSAHSQKPIANAVSEAVVNSKLHRSGITDKTSSHTHLLSMSLMQTDAIENRHPLNRCSPQYASLIQLPKVLGESYKQNLTTAIKGELLASNAGKRAVKHRQVESGDANCISSGNNSGDYHHQQDKEMNDLAAINHMYAERRRRKRQRECFAELRRLVPNIRKRDKVTVLEHTIMFIKDLKSKADELERLYSLKDELLASDLG